MGMSSILLDTNAYTGLINGDTGILEYMAQADTIYISTVMLGELYAGFYGGSKFEWNCDILNDFLDKDTISIVDVSHNTSKIFGKIKNELRLKGAMIPLNDIWIAAHSLETNSTLLAFDKHFANISELKIWPGAMSYEQ